MATTASDVKDVAPELSTETDARVLRFIAHASPYVNTSVWGAKADFARALMAAHLLTMSNRHGAAGPVTSETVGQMSRSYGTTPNAAALASTSYGQQFIALRRSVALPMVVT